MLAATHTHDAARDFDFWRGTWRVHNHRRKERLRDCTEWEEFEATSTARPLLSGLGNEDDFRTSWGSGLVGTTLRLFDRATNQWFIYWADNQHAGFQPPVVGAWLGDKGIFEGDDSLDGRPIRVRFTWTRGAGERARWEQAFSPDGGTTWETNWVMEMERP